MLDPYSETPLIKLIIGASVSGVPGLNLHADARADSRTNLVLLSKTGLGLLRPCCFSLQLVEPHFELPQALSLLSLQEVGVGSWGETDVEVKGKKNKRREEK